MTTTTPTTPARSLRRRPPPPTPRRRRRRRTRRSLLLAAAVAPPTLLLLLSALLASRASAARPVTLVDPSGALTSSPLPPAAAAGGGGGGLVALLSSPGTPGSHFPTGGGGGVTIDDDAGVLSAPGAVLEESPGLLARGAGAAAAAAVSSAVILAGVTGADAEVGLEGTRHGRTLAEVFASALRGKGGEEGETKPTLLLIAVQGEPGEKLDSEDIAERVEEIFEGVAAAVGSDDELSDRFVVRSMLVTSASDAAEVLKAARAYAAETSPASSPAAFADAYKSAAAARDDVDVDPVPVAEAILACHDATSRASKLCRAELAGWKHRVNRGLLVPKYGKRAEALSARTLDLFDRDTMAAAGLPRAGAERLILRNELKVRVEGILRRLFEDQMGLLEKKTLKRFQASLLRKLDKDADIAEFFDSNADALRAASFAFDAAASSLEIPSLSLTKDKSVAEATSKLNAALLSFPDSPAAKIKSLSKISRTVNKKKPPSEGSIDVALDLVAMIRPDGFGNLQGFAGYQWGPHGVTVGVHNDADDPGVISQFGGTRPPFVRVQPKLKLDVEL